MNVTTNRPQEPDVVVQERDHRVGERRSAAGGCSPGGSRVGLVVVVVVVVTKQARSASSSTPPSLHGLQRARRQAATTVPLSTPSSRTAWTRRSSTSGSTYSGWGSPGRSGAGTGAAVPGTAHAGLERESNVGSSGPFHVLRRPQPGLDHQLRKRRSHTSVPSRSTRPAESRRATMTKSWSGVRPSSSPQKASRSARLTPFRSTAPPTLRLTEIPRRTPSAPSRSRAGRRRGRGSGWHAIARRGRRGRSHRFATGGRAACGRPSGRYGAKRLRPLRRRRRITSRPPRVRIRARNPWVRARLRFFGCQVRFMRRRQSTEPFRRRSRAAPIAPVVAGCMYRGRVFLPANCGMVRPGGRGRMYGRSGAR